MTQQSLPRTDFTPIERPEDVRRDVDSYRGFHDETSGGTVDARKDGYEDMVKGYYDLVTDIFEHGWGESFHFAPRFEGEAFHASVSRHQHFLAHRMNLQPGMRVLDLGCGIGGPMRGVARFSGATIVGVNNNRYQLGKAAAKNKAAGLDHLCELLEANFMEMPLEDGSYDGAYGFEATCHAPDKTALFTEVFRVLKPGAEFAAYEWCLTDRYDGGNAEHRRIKKGIEEGDGLPDIWTVEATLQCLRDAGFEIVEHEDRALSSDPKTPWHLPITGRERSLLGFRRSKVGRRVAWGVIRVLEGIGKAPKGTLETSKFLHAGCDALVEGGDTGIFTPMLYFRARKPA